MHEELTDAMIQTDRLINTDRTHYRRLGTELPDDRTRRAHLTGQQSSTAPIHFF
jgi:hypothetical protein